MRCPAARPAETAAPVRVLYVFGSLDPRSGGPSNSAPNIWMSAARAGVAAASAFTADAPASEAEARMIGRLAAAGVELHTFAVSGVYQLRRWGVSLPLAAWVLRHARSYDIVHAHGAWMAPSVVGFVAARLAGRRFVLTPHEHLTDGDVGKGTSRFRHWVKGAVRRLYLRWTDLIILASRTEARASISGGSATASEVIHHPVIADAADLPPPRSFAGGGLRVGFLGRFDPKKRIELAIEAVAGVPGTRLLIAGGGDDAYEARLKALAERAGVADRVRWLGFLRGPALPDFFAGIDVLAMPSRFEGFGMVAAEAMSHGVPVIVSEASGIGELVARYECGLVIASDAAALAAALADLQRDPARLAWYSRHAIEACRLELSFDAYGAKLAAAYRALAAR